MHSNHFMLKKNSSSVFFCYLNKRYQSVSVSRVFSCAVISPEKQVPQKKLWSDFQSQLIESESLRRYLKLLRMSWFNGFVDISHPSFSFRYFNLLIRLSKGTKNLKNNFFFLEQLPRAQNLGKESYIFSNFQYLNI